MNINDAKVMLSSLAGPLAVRQEQCDHHGKFDAKNLFGKVWSKCPKCVAEQDAQEQAERELKDRERQQLIWQQKLGASGIPDRFHDRRLETFVAETPAQRRALDFAKSYADGFDGVLATGRSALFLGKPGTGKTHLACGIGLQIMQRDKRRVLFTTVMRAIRRVRDTWSKNREESETQAIEALAMPDLLILDEVGVQSGTEAEKLLLFDILNERYEKRRPSLLLSNLTVGEVKAFLGERVFDRLREDGGEAITFDWSSHRGKA